MRVINNASLFLLLLIFAFGCKKKDDGKGPEVNWLLPQQFATISAVDTFLVEAEVSDTDGVERVSVNLTDESGNFLASMGDEFPSQTNYQLNKQFFLNRPDLATGNYFLHLEAYDQENRTSVFREINLQPIPWKLYATVIAHGNPENAGLAVRSDEDNSWQTISSDAGNVISIAGMHDEHLILISTGTTGKVRAYQYPDWNVEWTFEIPNNTNLRNIEATDLNERTSEMVIADTDQQFYLIDRNGQSILVFDSDLLQHQAKSLLLTPDRIYAVEEKMDGSTQSFSAYFKVSGALKNRVYFPGEVMKMFEERSNTAGIYDEVVVFLSEAGTPKMKIFDRDNGSFSEPVTLPSGDLNAVCRIGNQKYLIQIDETIYHYNFSGTFQIYYTGEAFLDLIYDPANDLVLGLTNGEIHYLNIQGNGLQTAGIISAPGDLFAAGLLLNR